MSKKFMYTLVFTLIGSALLSGCPEVVDPNPSLNPSPRLFKTLFRYTTGNAPSATAVADLNNDTLKDLVTANRADNTVSVLIAGATAGFKAKVDYAVGVAPAALALADINKDGKLDIVTANAGGGNVSVLLGAGDGTFGAAINAALLSNSVPADLVVADLNQDNELDVAVACSGNNTVSILDGNGDGTFGLVPRILNVGKGPRSILVADIDKNNVLDLVTANRDSNSVSILFGQADFSYAAAQSVSVGVNPRTVRAANLDAYGWLDLVTSNPGSGDLSVVLSSGSGNFHDEARVDVDRLPTRFVLQDFDNDGKLDLAVLLFSEGTDGQPLGVCAVLPGDGEGGFGAPRLFGAGAGAIDIQALKFDGDPRYDLITAGGTTVNILYGISGGGFETEERFPVGPHSRAIAVEDFDRDGKKDLAVTSLDNKTIAILLGHGDGTFEAQEPVTVSGIPRAIAAGLINTDNNPDLVVTNLDDNRVSVLLGKGDGTFQTERLVSIRVATETRSSQPRSVTLADMNGDSKLDLITGNAGTDSVAICLGNGDGTFKPVQEFFAFNFPLDVTARDFNGDGKLDIAVVNGTEPNSAAATAPRVNVIFGKGDGTLDPDTRLSYTTSAGPRGMAVAALSGDSNLDAITVQQGDNKVSILAGRPGGKLTAGVDVRVGTGPNCVTVGDINRDGKIDVMTTNDSNTLSVLLGAGGTAFSLYIDFPMGTDPIGGVLADINGDSRLDAIVANRSTSDISVVLGAPL